MPRNRNLIYPALSLGAGTLLTIMTFLNGLLSHYTSPITSSLIVHFVGLLMSVFLWMFIKRKNLISPKLSIHYYWGGLAGALAVVTANVAVNSTLGLAGSLSCFIFGQTITSLLFDRFGLFGNSTRKLRPLDGIRSLLIMTGAILVIYSGQTV
ncbi:DMT family transporter [Spirochaeta cellobiosiphila]|uniref:DMT family transporter n=1 Tax=Spirochaeta cellobiosiphila TaxID=504483 RepID=UPI000410F1D5|nr:DMT family transporter [Spirochaeta cellobiosiphila]